MSKNTPQQKKANGIGCGTCRQNEMDTLKISKTFHVPPLQRQMKTN